MDLTSHFGSPFCRIAVRYYQCPGEYYMLPIHGAFYISVGNSISRISRWKNGLLNSLYPAINIQSGFVASPQNDLYGGSRIL